MSGLDPLFGSAPAGTDLSESKAAGNDAAVIVLAVIASLAVGMRLWARTVQKLQLQADDYLIVIALVFTYATAGLSITGGVFGSGKHVWAVPTGNILIILKILFGYTTIYGCANAFTKLSVICFYHRIFGWTDRLFNYAIFFAGFIAAAFPLIILSVMLGACRPLDYYWLEYTDVNAKGKCLVNVDRFFLAMGIINMLTDILILSIPIPKIYQLQMSARKKWTVSGIMLLGSFVCVASIVRIYYLVLLQTAIDLTWLMGPIFIWSCVEPSIGVLSACLPVMAPLLRIIFRNWVSSSSNSNSHSLPRRKSGSGLPKAYIADGAEGWRNLGSDGMERRVVAGMGVDTIMAGDDASSEDAHITGTGEEWKMRNLKRKSFGFKFRPDDDEVGLTNEASAGGNPFVKDSEMPDKGIFVHTQVDQVSDKRDTGEYDTRS